jgi:hypothetical protein
VAINTRLHPGSLWNVEHADVKAEMEIAREKYSTFRDALKKLSENDQRRAEVNEKILAQTVALGDYMVKWGSLHMQFAISSPGMLDDESTQMFVSCCAETLVEFLGMAEERCNDEASQSRVLIQQAKRVADILMYVERAWPWSNLKAFEESWRQYHSGTLMDFESFKNELLRSA